MAFNNKQVFNIKLNSIEFYKCKKVQKEIADKVRALLKENKNLSHEAIIEEMSLIPTLRILTVTIPLRGDVEGVQQFFVGEILVSRRWLSYFLQTDDLGYPLRPPRQLNHVRMLDLYAKIKAAQKGTAV